MPFRTPSLKAERWVPPALVYCPFAKDMYFSPKSLVWVNANSRV
ncbi:MAG: hypothetical protein BWX47_00729 [candidate division Hyd24-12 bacterium ADurb.Bin004]|nr:MAG: hypothetical protein BWX47_00729 [candidate division Hyd24-12 bacterium ADurb.Bin004]